MLDAIHDAISTSSNVVPLSDLLRGTRRTFHRAVLEALIREGFEMEETLPNLQRPAEILGALGNLETDRAWESFREALRLADRAGILVDLGAFDRDSAPPRGSLRFRSPASMSLRLLSQGGRA